jgi:hypothetical protein
MVALAWPPVPDSLVRRIRPFAAGPAREALGSSDFGPSLDGVRHYTRQQILACECERPEEVQDAE